MMPYTASFRRAARAISPRHIIPTLALSALAACGGSDDPTSPSTPTAALRLTNGSARTVSAVYVSPCTSDTWGNNRLTGTISPNGVRTFSLPAGGCYDVRVVATDGHSWRRDDVNVDGTTGVRVD